MTELLTAAQMRAIEQAAIESGEVTGLELMERAGQGVVDAIMEWRPELATAPHHAMVLCGPGNNGGDGFVVARLLKHRGWKVEVFLEGNEAKLPPDAAENRRRWLEIGEVESLSATDYEEEAFLHTQADLLVDALFGSGITRSYQPIESINRLYHDVLRDGYYFYGEIFKPYLVSIDIVSGRDVDSGRILGNYRINKSCSPDYDDGLFMEGTWSEMGAHLTVTFHRPKVGHFIDTTPSISGELRVVDIGLPQDEPDPTKIGAGAFVRLAGRPDRRRKYFWHPTVLAKGFPPDRIDNHKYNHGHALILAGGRGKGGAARLAARGALRIGAGLVTLGCPPEASSENAARLDAIMLSKVYDVDGLKEEIRNRKITAVCIGPGFGLGNQLRTFVTSLLGGDQFYRPSDLPWVVLDADALTEFRDDPDTLVKMLHENCIITPHAGEFQRLFPDIAAKLWDPAPSGPAYSKVDATLDAAARAGCTVLFKGADTVIADELGNCVVNSAHYERSAPWLATAGSGDALAGFITGLLARDFVPLEAAETAAWLHVECALKFGPGLIAEDIPEQLPAVFRDLGL